MNETDDWRVPPSSPALASDEVHVWRMSLAVGGGPTERFESYLDADERTKAARFYFPKHRQAYIVSHGVLRLLLGRYLDAAPADIQFSYNANGKPACLGHPDLCLNLSHSGDLVLYAVTRRRQIGVDVERNRPLSDILQIAQRCFSQREFAVLQSVPSDQQQQAFFNGWTRKEAYIKGRGEGLSHPLQEFDVTLAVGEPATLLVDRSDPSAAARWRLRELAPGPGYTAAVAVEGCDWRLCCWQWAPEVD